jgi:hypothetical protein
MAKEIHIAAEYTGTRYKKGKIGTLWWDNEMGEGDVTMSVEFLQEDWLTKADALQDFICLLTREYNKVLDMKEGVGNE